MKKINIFLALIVLLSGIQPSFAQLRVPTIGDGNEGSGGGGVLNPNPIEKRLISEAVAQSKMLLTGYFNERMDRFLRGYPVGDDDQKLFTGKENIFTLLSQVKIQVLEDKPCTHLGRRVDGSAHRGEAFPICISSLRLSTKLNNQNYIFETAALIAHELFHLIDASEDEAVILQKEVMATLQTNQFNLVDNAVRVMINQLGMVNSVLQFALMGKYSTYGTMNVVLSIKGLPRGTNGYGIDFFSHESRLLLNTADLELNLLYDAFCIPDPSPDALQWRSLCTGHYEYALQGKKVLPADEVRANFPYSGQIGNLPVYAVHDLTTADLEIKQVMARIELLQKELDRFVKLRFEIR